MEQKASTFILFLLFFKTTISIKILTFSRSGDGIISQASLKDKESKDDEQYMPFGFCGSFKESFVDGKSFFTLYGEDEKPFLGFSVWPGSQEDNLVTWLRIRQVWRRVGDADMFWLNFWTHVCLVVNVRFKEIKVSVNGQEPVSIPIGDLMIQAPKDPKGGVIKIWSASKYKKHPNIIQIRKSNF